MMEKAYNLKVNFESDDIEDIIASVDQLRHELAEGDRTFGIPAKTKGTWELTENMSREIKFRAWDKKEKVMGLPFDFQKFAYEVASFFQGDYEFLQYTGLKDKNGVEIYEGDIVDLGESWNPGICEVLFNRGGYCFRFKKDDGHYPDGKYLTDGIVIGNIYQNPELLKND